MERGRLQAAMRGIAAILVFVAIVAQAADLASIGRFDPTRFFAFFTIQSNLFGATLFLILAIRGRRGPSHAEDALRGAAVVYLSVTFIVVVVLLSGADLQVALPWVDFVLHKVFPVVVVLDWLLDPPRTRLSVRDALIWLVYPLIWLVVTLSRGALDGWYPYPFLDPSSGGDGPVALTIVGIALGFLVIGSITIGLGRWLGRARAARPGSAVGYP